MYICYIILPSNVAQSTYGSKMPAGSDSSSLFVSPGYTVNSNMLNIKKSERTNLIHRELNDNIKYLYGYVLQMVVHGWQR